MKTRVIMYCRVATKEQLLPESRPQMQKPKAKPSKEAFLNVPLFVKPFDFCSREIRASLAKYDKGGCCL